MPERLLHPADVAEILGVTKRRASELMRTMRCVNVSRNPACMNPRWAVTASEIDRWQKARTAIPDQRVDTPPARPDGAQGHRHGWRLTWSCSSRTDGLSAAGRPNNASPAARPTGKEDKPYDSYTMEISSSRRLTSEGRHYSRTEACSLNTAMAVGRCMTATGNALRARGIPISSKITVLIDSGKEDKPNGTTQDRNPVPLLQHGPGRRTAL